jgi:hypothetical protein
MAKKILSVNSIMVDIRISEFALSKTMFCIKSNNASQVQNVERLGKK